MRGGAVRWPSMTTRMVIIGGGPAGHSCASTAARLGADVVVIERDTIGGAAHLWDCIPSKAMIATGNARQFLRRSARMGLAEVGSDVDLDQLRDRLKHIESRLETTVRGLLDSQRVELVDGFGRMVDAHTVVATLPDGTERTFTPTWWCSRPAAVLGFPSGRRSMANACSRPEMPTLHRSCLSTSS